MDEVSAQRQVRQERSDQALITLFASVLNKPLALREFTPQEQALREARRRARQEMRGWVYGPAALRQPVPELPLLRRAADPGAPVQPHA